MRSATNRARWGPFVITTAIGTASGFGTGTRSSAAQENGEPVRIAYRAPAGCPDEAAFATRIRAATTRARIAWPGERAWSFFVVLDTGPPASGSVRVDDGEVPKGTRWVHGGTCLEVADALALVIALALDPHAAPPPAAPASPSQHDAPPDESAVEPSSANQAFFAGADLAFATGVSPNILFGGSPYVGWRVNGASFFKPSLRLAFLRSASGTVGAPSQASASFTWTVGRLDACPAGWARGALRATACARVEAGTLEVQGVDVSVPLTKIRAWLAAGVLARGEWSVARSVFVDGEVGALFRATNDRFYVPPDETVYQVPIVGWTTAIGLGVLFL